MDSKELFDTTPIAQLVDSIGAKSVFGEPTTENGVVIIPVAQVEYGFGYGGGYGPTFAAAEAGDEAVQAVESEEASADGADGDGANGDGAMVMAVVAVAAVAARPHAATSGSRRKMSPTSPSLTKSACPWPASFLPPGSSSGSR